MLVIVAFVSQKGGVGKSTLARALATVAAAENMQVKIADLDAQQHTVQRWQERREENRAGPRIAVESADTVAAAISRASPDNLLLIVDGPPRSNRGALEIARRADLIVQPSNAGVDDLDPAILLFHELVREGIPRENLVLALCRVGSQAEEDAARNYVQRAGYFVLPGSIPERTAYREAHNRGQAITEVKHDTRTDTLMQNLVSLITGRVKARVLAAQSRQRNTGSAA